MPFFHNILETIGEHLLFKHAPTGLRVFVTKYIGKYISGQNEEA